MAVARLSDQMKRLVAAGCASAVGAMTRAREFEPQAPRRLIGVRFRPGAAVPFLRVAAHEITDGVVDSADLGLRWLAPMRNARHMQLDEAVRELERLLLQRLAATPRRPDTHDSRAGGTAAARGGSPATPGREGPFNGSAHLIVLSSTFKTRVASAGSVVHATHPYHGRHSVSGESLEADRPVQQLLKL